MRAVIWTCVEEGFREAAREANTDDLCLEGAVGCKGSRSSASQCSTSRVWQREPRQALVTLLKGRDPYDVSGSSTHGFHCWIVHEAPLLVDQLRVETEENWNGVRVQDDGGGWWLDNERRGTGVRGQELRTGHGICRRVRLLLPLQTLEWNH